jgi:hypothetical protein
MLLFATSSSAQFAAPSKAIPLNQFSPDSGWFAPSKVSYLSAITNDTPEHPKTVLADTNKKVDTSKKVQDLDTVKFDMYGNLRVDDPVFNKKDHWYVPALNIVGQEILLNLADQYLLDFSWARIGLNSWASNLSAGPPWGNDWIWDDTRFANDMFLHPYTGANYFDAARASGYDFWESSIYTFGGSYLWKIFGENGAPERNSLIYTTLGGMFGGEIMYRLSSNVLDDRTTGTERTMREIVAGLVSPSRFLTGLFDGKLTQVTDQEVYKKEPLNITLFAGIHQINPNNNFLSGQTSELLNLQIDYGNPFERIDRKPYDFFKIIGEADFGLGRKIINDVTGYGILTGSNGRVGKWDVLSGIFQNYDYYDNPNYELTTLGFGYGLVTRYPLLSNWTWYSTLNLDIVPFGGNNTRFGPNDTTQTRDFNFGGGAEGKLESTLNLGDKASFKLVANYYWFHTYVGEPGNNFIALLKPRVTVGIFDNLSVGIEQTIYSSIRESPDFSTINKVTTEQKIFFMYYFEDSHRGGHYN